MRGSDVEAGAGARPASYRPEEYWETLVGRRFDLREVGYPELSLAYNELLYRGMAATVDAALRHEGIDRAFLERASVLDVGSGVGFWIDFWLRRGARELTGVDLTRSSVERLAARHPGLSFERRDVADPLPEEWVGAFDVISTMSVLNHIPDPERWRLALANLGRMLRPGGVLLFMDPISRHTLWGLRPGVATNGRVRSVDEHREVLRAQGVEVERVLPTISILANPVDTRSRLEFRLLERWWGVLARIARRERLMKAAGPVVYALDRALSRAGYMPSSKVLVARRPAGAGSAGRPAQAASPPGRGAA